MTQTSISAISRRQRIYLGSLHPDTTVENVNEYLNNQLKLTERVNDEIKQTAIQFFNLTEDRPALPNDKPKRVKSFTFEVAFVNRKIVEDKQIWPKDSFVDYSFFPKSNKQLATIANKLNPHTSTTTSSYITQN